LGEIEACLAQHEGVREVKVLAREDASGEKRLVAYVVARAAGEVAVETLRAYLKEVLPAHMVPSAFVMLDQLPLTPTGKIDRRALPVPQLSSFQASLSAPPQGALERALAEIWCGLLQIPQLGRDDNL
jgi:non-ribosomal peptide synthetase component E (peptide arylation enzyme)